MPTGYVLKKKNFYRLFVVSVNVWLSSVASGSSSHACNVNNNGNANTNACTNAWNSAWVGFNYKISQLK
jgi:hypothetical protein